ncbi:MAG: hypothetical protein ABIT71_24925 [Vicinamibacteraceae bacterium]
MRNALLMGVTVSALSFMAVPASAQVRVTAQVAVPRSQDDGGWEAGRTSDDDYRDGEFDGPDESRDDEDYGYSAGDERGYRGFGFGIQIGGGSANEYGPYGYRDRGYGVYSEWGNRGGRSSSLRAAFDFGRRDGYEAGIDAARFGRFEPVRHRYYRSTRGWERRFGTRDAYDVNYRNGFERGYQEGYRTSRRSRRW